MRNRFALGSYTPQRVPVCRTTLCPSAAQCVRCELRGDSVRIAVESISVPATCSTLSTDRSCSTHRSGATMGIRRISRASGISLRVAAVPPQGLSEGKNQSRKAVFWL